MIQYSSMTLRQATDEIMLRVRKLSTSVNFDTQLASMYISEARRMAMAMSLPFKDYAYIKTFAVSNGVELPQDFVCEVRTLLKDPSVDEYSEARKADVREWWTLTNTVRPHSFNNATLNYPAYTIWGSDDSDAAVWNSKGMVVLVAPTTTVGIIEYYAEYGDMVLDTETLNVPYEFENLIILLALVSIYAKIGEPNRAVETYKSYQEGIMKIRLNEIARRNTETHNIQSLALPVPTQIQSIGKNN